MAICPYDYFKEIRMLAKNLFIESQVMFMLVKKIDFLEKWKKYFDL